MPLLHSGCLNPLLRSGCLNLLLHSGCDMPLLHSSCQNPLLHSACQNLMLHSGCDIPVLHSGSQNPLLHSGCQNLVLTVAVIFHCCTLVVIVHCCTVVVRIHCCTVVVICHCCTVVIRILCCTVVSESGKRCTALEYNIDVLTVCTVQCLAISLLICASCCYWGWFVVRKHWSAEAGIVMCENSGHWCCQWYTGSPDASTSGHDRCWWNFKH